jgi:hypothetical protein
MASYTIQQRVQIVELFYENKRSVKSVYRKLREFYGLHNRPTESTIGRIVKKFQETGSVEDQKSKKYSRSGRSQENIDLVRESVAEDPEMSIRRRSQQVGLSESTTWRILHKDLALKAYKVQITQELKPLDHLKRRSFPGRVIARNGDVNWPPRSCDLTPLDYFLWGYVKSQVYKNNPQSIPELKDKIIRVIGEIEPQLCQNVIENFNKRVDICGAARGGHLEDIIFRI